MSATGIGATAGAFPAAVAQVLGADGAVAGAGFLIAENLLATCAHVVLSAGSGPGERLSVSFPHACDGTATGGSVLDQHWSGPDDADVAIVRLDGTPTGSAPVALGTAVGCRGRRMRSFGFPRQAPPGGHFGFAVGGDLLPPESGPLLLQLTEANDLTTGFSGAPVLNETTGLVVGMITAITAPDEHLRGQGIAYVTPTQTLRTILPQLIEQDLSPYRGLEPFEAEHAPWFRGRSEAVRQVVAALARQHVVLLLGPSGAGKSSLIHAGVLPALARGGLPGSDQWVAVCARPRLDLFAELEAAGLPGVGDIGIAAAVAAELEAASEGWHIILVIDQLEELLTGPAEGHQAPHGPAQALDQLARAIGSHHALHVVLVMRDDFYPRLAALAPGLLEAVLPGLLNIPAALNEQELAEIIKLPARDGGAELQDGLAEQIIADVLAADPHAAPLQASATVLPLLELTLSQLWKRRSQHDGRLTHEAYRRVGGVAGSLTTWCDAALEDLSADRRPVAQRILTALVRPADQANGVPATRQQVRLGELHELAGAGDGRDSEQGHDEVLSVLTRHRIITTQLAKPPGGPADAEAEPVAELIHEALIRDWKTLRDWVGQDQRFHTWLRQARSQLALWRTHRNRADLISGTALAEGLDWERRRRTPRDVHEFLRAGRRATRRRVAVTRAAVALLTALVVALTYAVVVGAQASTKAIQERDSAIADQLVAQSQSLAAGNPLASQIDALAAWSIDPSPGAHYALSAAADSPEIATVAQHHGEYSPVAFSPDGRLLASGDGGSTVQLWDLSLQRQSAISLHGDTNIYDLVFSDDGRYLAAVGADDVQVWDTASGNPLGRPYQTDPIDGAQAAFGASGETLDIATAGWMRVYSVSTHRQLSAARLPADALFDEVFSQGLTVAAYEGQAGEVSLWDTIGGRPIGDLPGTAYGQGIAFSPDASVIAAPSISGAVQLWRTDPVRPLDTALGISFPDPSGAAVFSADGRTMAVLGSNGSVGLWHASGSGTDKIATGPDTGNIVLSADGRTLAGISGSTVQLWDTSDGLPLGTPFTGAPGLMDQAEFSPDGRFLVTTTTLRRTSRADDPPASDYTDTAQLWNVSQAEGRRIGTPLANGSGPVEFMAFSPHGDSLASISDNSADGCLGSLQLWSTATHAPLGGPISAPMNDAAISPDGRTVATYTNTGGCDTTVRLWDPAAGPTPEAEYTLPTTSLAGPVAFSPTGQILAIGRDYPSDIQLWNVQTRTRVGQQIPGPPAIHGRPPEALDFSPDGRTLAVLGPTLGDDLSDGGQDLYLWNATTQQQIGDAISLLGPVMALSYNPAGTRLATLSQPGGLISAVQIWSTATQQQVDEVSLNTGAVVAAAFSPDLGTLATVAPDGTVQLWDLATSQPIGAPISAAGSKVAFNPTGDALATGGTSVQIWDVSFLTNAIARVCSDIGGALTLAEWQQYVPSGPQYRDVC